MNKDLQKTYQNHWILLVGVSLVGLVLLPLFQTQILTEVGGLRTIFLNESHSPYFSALQSLGLGILGNSSLWIVPVVCAVMIVYVIYGLSHELLRALGVPELHRYLIPVWVVGVAAVAPSITARLQTELVVTVLTLASIYWIVRMYRTGGFSDAVLAISAVSFAMIIRPDYALSVIGLLVVVLIQSIVMLQASHYWKRIGLIMSIPFVILGLFYIRPPQIPGSITYYSQSGYPVINTEKYQPITDTFTELNQELNSEVNKNYIFREYHSVFWEQYPSLIQILSSEDSFRSMYNRMNQNLPINIIGFLILIFGASLIWISRRSGIWYLILGIGVPYGVVWATFTSHPGYLQMQYILLMVVTMTCVAVVVPLLTKFQRQTFMVLLAIITVYSAISPVSNERGEVTSSAKARDNLMSWILTNTSENDRIFTTLQREVSSATGRETVWDTRIWLVEGIPETIRLWEGLYHADYVIVDQDHLKAMDNTYGDMSRIVNYSTVDSLFRQTRVFEKVYEDQENEITVYKYHNGAVQ